MSEAAIVDTGGFGLRGYVFKLHPSRSQVGLLEEQCRMMADLWNALKQRCEDVYRRERKALTYFDLTNEITGLRHECPEWSAVPALTSHRVAKQLTDAYSAFFRRVKAGKAPGYPRWKSRKHATTIPLGTMLDAGWQLRRRQDNPLSWRLHYKSVTDIRKPETWIHARGALPIPATSWKNANIIRRDGRWWLSVCVEVEPRRSVGRHPVTVVFDLIDDFASVNGIAETPDGLAHARDLQDCADALKSERDLTWPRGCRLSDEEHDDLRDANAEISRLLAKSHRVRKHALHVWTAHIVSRASDLTVVSSAIQPNTASPHGNERQWGAHVETVSSLNRHILSQAPYMATSMLIYKAAEAGIRCDVVTEKPPTIAVGGDLVTAGKRLRRARREFKRSVAA